MTNSERVEALAAALRARYHFIAVHTEYLFAPRVDGKPVRRWRFDVAMPNRRMAIEVDGSLFTGGRHGGTPGAAKDLEKRQAAACYGWIVLHLTPRQAEEAARGEGRGFALTKAFLLSPSVTGDVFSG